MSTVVEKFLNYVTFDTTSNEDSSLVPSTKGQLIFATKLVEELKNIGLKDVSVDNNGYIMATLPSNTKKNIPVIGFISHMDTNYEVSGKDIKPQIIKNYDGKDIVLNKDKNVILSISDFPEVKNYVGKDIITTDGTTLLGADDKAGIAEILTAMEYFINHPKVLHGEIRVGFTPDEEIGRGADFFDVEKFNAKYAYTIDGGRIGELEYENFNAAVAKIVINGRNVHPGYAKDKMVNAILIANEFINMLPKDEVPEKTEGYEGFFHLLYTTAEVEGAKMQFIIRDFEKEAFEKRKNLALKIGEDLNNKYGKNTVEITVKDQYYNMKEKIEECKEVVDIAFKAMEEVGIVPKVNPIRGGTDGSRLSFMGLPTPNIFTGGENFHGKFEFIPIFAMEKAVQTIIKITELYEKQEK